MISRLGTEKLLSMGFEILGLVRTNWNVSVHSRLNRNLEVLVFMKGEKPDSLEKNFSKQRKNQQQIQTTYGINARIQIQATLVGGKCSHHCATLAPPYWYYLNISSRQSAHMGCYASLQSELQIQVCNVWRSRPCPCWYLTHLYVICCHFIQS